MSNILEFYGLISIIFLEIICVCIFGLLIQLFFHQCFGINLYQKFNKWLDKLDQYLTNIFYKGGF